MKSYEKMAEDVLSRIGEIETKKAQQRKTIAKAGNQEIHAV